MAGKIDMDTIPAFLKLRVQAATADMGNIGKYKTSDEQLKVIDKVERKAIEQVKAFDSSHHTNYSEHAYEIADAVMNDLYSAGTKAVESGAVKVE